MKNNIFLGILLLYLANIIAGIHLRHQLSELRQGGQDKIEIPKELDEKKKLLKDPNIKYPTFVKTLQAYLDDERKNGKKELRESLKQNLLGGGAILSEPDKNDNSISPDLVKGWDEGIKYTDNKITIEEVKPNSQAQSIIQKLGLTGKLVSIPVSKLYPTQQDIGLQNSLDFAITQKDAQQYFGTEAKMILSPILTYKGQYIIDGHHRWSQLYMLNDKAKIVAYDIKQVDGIKSGDVKKEIEEVLKRLQVAIGGFFGKIGTANGKGTVDVYSKDLVEGTKDGIQMYFDCRFRLNDEKVDDCVTLHKAQKEKTIQEEDEKSKKDGEKDKYKMASEGFIFDFSTRIKDLQSLSSKFEFDHTNGKIKPKNPKQKESKDLLITHVKEVLIKQVRGFVEKTEESQKAFEKPIRDYMPQTDGPKKKDGPADIDEKMEDTVKIEKRTSEEGKTFKIKQFLPVILTKLIRKN